MTTDSTTHATSGLWISKKEATLRRENPPDRSPKPRHKCRARASPRPRDRRSFHQKKRTNKNQNKQKKTNQKENNKRKGKKTERKEKSQLWRAKINLNQISKSPNLSPKRNHYLRLPRAGPSVVPAALSAPSAASGSFPRASSGRG